MSRNTLARLVLSRGIKPEIISTALGRSSLGFTMDVHSHTKVDDIESDINKTTVQRKLEKGDREMIECSLPALFTVESSLNIPRNPGIRGVLKARSKAIVRQDLK